MKRLIPLCLIATTGCASIMAGPQPSVRADFDPRLEFPVSQVAKAKRLPGPTVELGGDTDGVDQGKLDETSPKLFWAGVVIGLVGSAALVVVGIDGRLTETKIEDGYEDGFTRQERDDLGKRGERDNTLAKIAAGTAVVGFSLATIMAGIDYSRCGPVSKRRKCERKAAK